MGSLRGNYYTLDYFCKSFHNFSLIFSYELEASNMLNFIEQLVTEINQELSEKGDSPPPFSSFEINSRVRSQILARRHRFNRVLNMRTGVVASKRLWKEEEEKEASSRQLANPFLSPVWFYSSPSFLLAFWDVQKSLSPGRWAVDKVNHGLIYDVELPFPYTSAGRSVFGSFVGRHLGRHVSCIVERML